MLRSRLATLALFTLVAPACSDDGLGSAVGEAALVSCDRGAACGCVELDVDSIIDFESPPPGGVSRRTLRIRNANVGRTLTVSRVEVSGDTSVFGVVGVQKRSSEDAAAEVTAHDLASGPLVLTDTEIAEVILAFKPTTSAEHTAQLTVISNSGKRPTWTLGLRGGAGASTTCEPSGGCGEGSVLDFGTFADADVGPGFAQTQHLTVTNGGSSEIFVRVELTDDGVPETLPGELVGEFGVFFLGELGCSVLAPGAQLQIPIQYRPFNAGEHEGEVVVQAVGEPVHVKLRGRVTGAHICFRTEDDAPSDSLLQFGEAPAYATPRNLTEVRRVWVGNCGYQADLVVSGVQAAAGSSGDFTTSALPWSATAPLAPGAEIEVAVTYTPDAVGADGTYALARWAFASNDRLSPTALLDLHARIGAAQRCVLVPSESPIDFGWVATDDAEQSGCLPGAPICPPPGPQISRFEELTLVNAGDLPCTSISITNLIEAPNSQGMFSIVDNPNGADFTLAPGATSQPIKLLFTRSPSDTVSTHQAKLHYDSPEVINPYPPSGAPSTTFEVLVKAKAGGSPNCAVDLQPVAPPSFFCPNESLAFGNVNYGQERTINVQIRNVGSQTCNVTNLRKQSGTSASFSFPTAPLTIPVGGVASLPVTFAPAPSSTNNPFEDLPITCAMNGIIMTVNSGANGANEDKTVALSGKGTRPDIDVIPGDVDFGLVTVGCCSAERRVAIYNSGDGELRIDSVGVLGSSDPGFSTTQPGDMVLSPGESTELFVRFCASGQGTSSGVVEIRSTDDNEEYFTISLTGTGTTDNAGDDYWQQPSRPTVDVLWVIDDSGSMGDEQNSLAANFDAFISTAVALDTDYHIGVVSTDVESEWAGKLYHCSANEFITDAQPEAEQRNQFRCNVKTADYSRPHSDSKEAALQAARMAVDYPNIGDYNAGFMREHATLYVIMVTDEEDQSDGTADLYVDFFRNIKGVGNPDLLNISAITGPPPNGCDTAAANPKGYDAVQAVGGQFRSICTADWSDLISGLGLDVFNARRQFALGRPATTSSIQVQVCDDSSGTPVNCQTVPQDATNGWTFDASVNAVTFNGGAVPQAGEHVQITYLAVCY